MTVTDTLYVSRREDWRAWLEANHETADEIWLVTYRKAANTPSLPYPTAVEEALCVGWIDSIRKGLDDERLAQRYTPRRPGAGYSQTNRERLARLLAQDRVLPHVRESLGPEDRADAFAFPEDVLAAIRASPEAWAFFETCSAPYRRIRVAYVDHARARPEAFAARLATLVTRCEQGRLFGYGIEAFY